MSDADTELDDVVADERRRFDELIIGALATGSTWEQAAERAGCSRRTVERRMAEPGFRARVVDAKDDVLDRTLALAANASLVSVNYLLRVVSGSENPDAGRIRAATALMNAVTRIDSHVQSRG